MGGGASSSSDEGGVGARRLSERLGALRARLPDACESSCFGMVRYRWWIPIDPMSERQMSSSGEVDVGRFHHLR